MTFAPCSRAISVVRSVLPQSTTIISSATSATDCSARPKRRSSFFVMTQKEIRFIGGFVESRTLFVKPSSSKDLLLFSPETHPNHAAPDAKFAAVLEHRSTHSLIVKKCSVRGIHVLQIYVAFLHLEHAVMARDFRIIQADVRALPSKNHSRLFEFSYQALVGALNHANASRHSRRQRQRWIVQAKSATSTFRSSPCK